MFRARTRELAKLDQIYASNRFECLALYGGRRVGKTALLKRWMNGKLAIYVLGMESGAGNLNLDNFNAALARFGGLDESFVSYPTLRAAVEAVFRMAQKRPLVLILDEYPYIAKSYEGFSSVLQELIDRHRDCTQLKLVLCGSSMSYMKKNVLSYTAPLYGRTTAHMKLNPLVFHEASQFWEGMREEDLLLAYAMSGGIPAYAALVDPTLSMENNLRAMYFGSMAPL